MPEALRHLKNTLTYPPIMPHQEAMGAYFDTLLIAGVTEAYDPEVHGSESDYATSINLWHVAIMAVILTCGSRGEFGGYVCRCSSVLSSGGSK